MDNAGPTGHSREYCSLSDTCTAIADPSLWHGASRGGRSDSNLAFMRSTHYPTATPLPFGFKIDALSCVIRISDNTLSINRMQLRAHYCTPIVARSPVSHGYPFRFVVVRYARCQGNPRSPRYTLLAIGVSPFPYSPPTADYIGRSSTYRYFTHNAATIDPHLTCTLYRHVATIRARCVRPAAMSIRRSSKPVDYPRAVRQNVKDQAIAWLEQRVCLPACAGYPKGALVRDDRTVDTGLQRALLDSGYHAQAHSYRKGTIP
jgi:hypothetical protein